MILDDMFNKPPPEPVPSRFFIGLLWAIGIEICAVIIYIGITEL